MAIPRSYRPLVQKGFLPKEMPAAFTSSSMGTFPLPDEPNVSHGLAPIDASERHPVTFDIPRSGLQARRTLSIPSPTSYARLSWLMATHWPEIRAHIRRSKISLSTVPLNVKPNGRAVTMSPSNSIRRMAEWKAAAHCRHSTYIDVSNFYGSIYTHAIDWAFRGKEIAKQYRHANTLGHHIDSLLQDCNDRQTAGIAVGPDTSRILSEVLLSAVDEQLATALPGSPPRSFRVYDDVWHYGASAADAEEFVMNYSRALSNYELTLNSSKVISQVGYRPSAESWILDMQRILRQCRAPVSVTQLGSILDETLALYDAHRSSTLSYFLSSLKSPIAISSADHWKVFGEFLALAMRLETATITHAHRFSAYADSTGRLASHKRFEQQIGEFLEHSIRMRRPYETAVAINILTDVGTVIENGLANAGAALENDLVDLLTLEAATKVKRLIPIANDITQRARSNDSFESGHWLLAYQVQRADAPSARSPEFKKGWWSQLADSSVTFMRDPAQSPTSRWYRARLKESSQRAAY